jgi:hypothetical protein
MTETQPTPAQGEAPSSQAPANPPAQQEVVLNDRGAHSAYSNFARVTATPEEVVLDFGLNLNPFHPGRQDLNISQRLIMNFYTAKRLFSALGMTLQRHEQNFGPIEIEVRRRTQR